jgi:hypothetical protein
MKDRINGVGWRAVPEMVCRGLYRGDRLHDESLLCRLPERRAMPIAGLEVFAHSGRELR